MQTFLPYPDYEESAFCLDRRRLGKQRVEVLQLLKTFMPSYQSKAWINHPARLMWKNYTISLAYYGLVVCKEWVIRGYRDTCYDKIVEIIFEHCKIGKPQDYDDSLKVIKSMEIKPHWLGREDFHASHRSNLLRKDPIWYGRYGWNESSDLPYVWPT